MKNNDYPVRQYCKGYANMIGAVWITWENQVRNKSMASSIGAKLFVFTCEGSRLKRYFYCALRTIGVIMSERPSVVFSQNPSIVLNALLLVMRIPFGYKFVSDAHFAGVISCSGSKSLQKLLDLCNKLANFVIVTNEEHANYIRAIGGNAVVCEDPLPDLTEYHIGVESIDKSVLFICSFDIDEPYKTVFAAADILFKEGFRLSVTGNYAKAGITPSDYPSVTFLGYLSYEEYYKNLFSSSVVIDLTENDNCLVCGAYEAMSAEKPLVTSNTRSLRQYFTKGTIFVNHDVISIVNAVRAAYENRFCLNDEIAEWREQTLLLQKKRIANIFTVLGFASIKH